MTVKSHVLEQVVIYVTRNQASVWYVTLENGAITVQRIVENVYPENVLEQMGDVINVWTVLLVRIVQCSVLIQIVCHVTSAVTASQIFFVISTAHYLAKAVAVKLAANVWARNAITTVVNDVRSVRKRESALFVRLATGDYYATKNAKLAANAVISTLVYAKAAIFRLIV